MTQFFQPQDVNLVMDQFLESLRVRMFGNGAPALPGGLGEDEMATVPAATSTGLEGILASFAGAPLHIPNSGDGANARHSYKSEVVLRKSVEQTYKIMWWHDKDPRTIPHNHPWPFRSAVLLGGYTEERFWLDEHGELHTEILEHNAGDVNTVPANVFHNVLSVKPGTVTFLECGHTRVGNKWGYLNTESKLYIPSTDLTSPNFLTELRELNPHLIPKPKA